MAFRVQGELAMDGSKFFAVMNRAQGAVVGFARGAVASVGTRLAAAFSIGAVSMFSKSVIDLASRLRDSATQLGVNVEWLQKMSNGAKLAGADVDDLSSFIFNLNKSRLEAVQDPKGKAAVAFQSMGIGQDKIKNLSTQEFVDSVVRSFRDGMTTEGQQALFEVGGKSARALTEAVATQFENDLPVIQEQVIDALEDLGDRFEAFSLRLKIGAAPLIVSALEIVNKAITGLRVSLAWVSALLKETFTGGFSGAMPRAMAAADAAAAEAAAKDALERNESVVAAENRKKNRQRWELAAPDFGELVKPPKQSAKKTASDSLVSVGNFLGASMRDVIADQALRVARDQLSVLRSIDGKMKPGTGATGFPA
ncbi:MAG: hypothetical protein RLY20_3210 [Verrucomicrobiota bacterium]